VHTENWSLQSPHVMSAKNGTLGLTAKLNDFQVSSDAPEEPGHRRVLHFNNLEAVFHVPQLWTYLEAMEETGKKRVVEIV
jgi:hypothetical protein